MTENATVKTYRDAVTAHAGLRARQKKERQALQTRHSDELKVNGKIVTKARRAAEKAALEALTAPVEDVTDG